MTVKQMHREFKISLDKVDSSATAELLPSEIDYYLNEATMRFVKTRYSQNNLYKKGFEESQKRTEDLKAIVVTRRMQISPDPGQSFAGCSVYSANPAILYLLTGTNVADTTSKYMIYLNSSLQLSKAGCSSVVSPMLVQQDDVKTLIKDPFNKPKADKPLILFEEGVIKILVPIGIVVDWIKCTFVRQPAAIYLGTYPVNSVIGSPVNCDLSDHTHKEIVQMAVALVIENTSNPRVQTIASNIASIE